MPVFYERIHFHPHLNNQSLVEYLNSSFFHESIPNETDCQLLTDIQNNRINRLFITYKDRLTRFGFNYLNEICKFHKTEIIQVSSEIVEKSVQEELAEDLCAIIHSFSGKLYGLRRSQLKDINTQLNTLKEVKDFDETG